MTRRHFTFSCKGTMLAGTVDLAPATTGLLIVSVPVGGRKKKL